MYTEKARTIHHIYERLLKIILEQKGESLSCVGLNIALLREHIKHGIEDKTLTYQDSLWLYGLLKEFLAIEEDQLELLRASIENM